MVDVMNHGFGAGMMEGNENARFDDNPPNQDAEEVDTDELKAFFDEWLKEDEYNEKMTHLISPEQKHGLRIIINLNEFRDKLGELGGRERWSSDILRHPVPFAWAISEAAKDLALSMDASFQKLLDRWGTVQVGFEGQFGRNLVTPRGLVSSFLRSLVSVEGIVTKCSSVRPKVLRSVHYCPATKLFSEKSYRDNTAPDIGLRLPGNHAVVPSNSSAYPTKDTENNPLETEYGYSTYRDFQTVSLQEMPESAPMGQLPRSVDVMMDADLVDRLKPGDRAQVVGIYRALATRTGQMGGTFSTVILANNVLLLGKDVGGIQMVPNDIVNIREAARRPDIVELLGRSLAPSICGHEFIKQALILQLLGGEEKNLANGTHLRGDVNILMVGDPSTAKSQLLRSIMNVAPLAINTTGRGSSGVGLTAAVATDKDTGERRLEAGAMVLADRGVVCIDEFDKMSEIDRVAIHEVMEQQTVTIAKAGIHACLNARCSVVGAANPVYGQYDRTKRPQENIGLPDSLLSRFDLLFVVLDQMDPESDRRISDHVLKGHRFRRRGADSTPDGAMGAGLYMEEGEAVDADREGVEAQPFEKSNPLLHGSAEVMTHAFLKKFILYAKSRVHPVLTDEASEYVATAYAQLRSKQDVRTLPVTARCLETIIRLSTACAKARLSTKVEESDCQRALDLMMFALYHETSQNDGEDGAGDVGGGVLGGVGQTDGGDDDDEGGGGGGSNGDGNTSVGGAVERAGPTADVEDAGASVALPETVREERLEQVRGVLLALFEADEDSPIPIGDILKTINRAHGSKRPRQERPFTSEELKSLLNDLSQAGHIFVSGGLVYQAG
jgi:DNA replication licensing factor MCM3